jgi:hypothetical protein
MPARYAAFWIRRQDYERIRSMVDDPDNLSGSFDEWLEIAQQHEAQFIAQGMPVERMVVDPYRFATWCRKRKIKADQKARMEYALHLLNLEQPGHG